MLVSIRRKKSREILAAEIMSAFMGPTYVTKWIMRQVKALGISEGEYEYQIGKKGAWQS